jgi:hypothetical protein
MVLQSSPDIQEILRNDSPPCSPRHRCAAINGGGSPDRRHPEHVRLVMCPAANALHRHGRTSWRLSAPWTR